MFWGFSEAFDVFEEFSSSTKSSEIPSNLNILLFGSSDSRHIIKSMAKLHRHEANLTFYILEEYPALIARQMMLLLVALDTNETLSAHGRVAFFLDLFGNSMMRRSTETYLSSRADYLLRCIDQSQDDSTQSIIDVTALKYSERDQVEDFLKFCRSKSPKSFNIKSHWTNRVIRHLGQRYDSRNGAFDWDLQMRLKSNGAQQICAQEYRHWRDTGIAFSAPLQVYSVPNKTLAISTDDRTGYVGDIEIGPYAAFGLHCDDATLMRSHYGDNEYRATDLTERNLFHLFYEIERQQTCPTDLFEAKKLGTTIIDLSKSLRDDHKSQMPDEIQFYDGKQTNMNGRVKIVFLSPRDHKLIAEGQKYLNHFHFAFVGRRFLSLLKSNFVALMVKPVAAIYFETAQYSTLRKEEISKFLNKVKNIANEMNLMAVTNFNINLPISTAKFIIEK